jgi:hypothetical protein
MRTSKRTEALVAASRLPSTRSQTRTATVAVRPLRRGQLRFAVPARIALPGGERASTVAIQSDRSPPPELVHPVGFPWDLSFYPCPRQEESSGPLRRAEPSAPPILTARARLSDPAAHHPVETHQKGCSCEPFENNKKAGWGQRFGCRSMEFQTTGSSRIPRQPREALREWCMRRRSPPRCRSRSRAQSVRMGNCTARSPHSTIPWCRNLEPV